jgi:hypothetical protein
MTRCPSCGGILHVMGLDFKAPKRTDTAAWKAAELLTQGGVGFSSCGCNGPGYRPVKPGKVDGFLEDLELQRHEGMRLLQKFKSRTS